MSLVRTKILFVGCLIVSVVITLTIIAKISEQNIARNSAKIDFFREVLDTTDRNIVTRDEKLDKILQEINEQNATIHSILVNNNTCK